MTESIALDLTIAVLIYHFVKFTDELALIMRFKKVSLAWLLLPLGLEEPLIKLTSFFLQRSRGMVSKNL